MILPSVTIPELRNKVLNECGLDNIAKVSNREAFYAYPFSVYYQYNSRGFRDSEWPSSINELQDSIWCLGDSFTAGIASPAAHTWPVILEKSIGKRCINVSMDGASNQWLTRQILSIVKEVQPKTIVVHWSYFHRNERDNVELTDMQRRLHYSTNAIAGTELDLLNVFIQLVHGIEQNKGSTSIIHTFIPQGPSVYDSTTATRCWGNIAGSGWPALPTALNLFNLLSSDIKKELKNFNEYERFKNFADFGNRYDQLLSSVVSVPELEQIDFARDGHHYDIVTATNFVNKLVPVIDELES